MSDEMEKLSTDELSRKFSGKLLLRNEIPLDETSFQKLLAERQFTAKASIQRKHFHYQCNRCGTKKRLSTIPCSLCHHTHLYCRNCIQMGRVTECQPLYYWTGETASWPKHENACSWEGELTNAQQQAADRMVRAIKHHEKELLAWAVCGAGKTEMLFPGITEALSLGKRICIATPRADVVQELLPRLQKAFQTIPIQALYGGSEEKQATAQILIATTHQLLRFYRAFDVLIIDEIDAFPFHKDESLPFAADRAKKQRNTTIYLTATPRKIHRTRMKRKKLPHIFVPVRFHGHPLPVPIKKMSYSLKKDLDHFLPPAPFMNWVKNRKNPYRQLLIFVPTIRLADKLQQKLFPLLKEEGIIENDNQLLSVHAEDPDRTEKVRLFRKKDIHILLTTTILERGVTFPSVDVAILDAGHEVFDEAALVQISGRAGRSPDDPTGEVVFFHDGKTEAMEQAIQSIQLMNNRGGCK